MLSHFNIGVEADGEYGARCESYRLLNILQKVDQGRLIWARRIDPFRLKQCQGQVLAVAFDQIASETEWKCLKKERNDVGNRSEAHPQIREEH